MGEILVTGGAGFIGTHTCIALLQAGYSVVILDNLCNAKQESLLHLQEITGKSIPFYHMDIRNADGLRQIFQTHHISAVLHFAGLKAVGESVQQPLRYYQNNIGGMMTLLEELQKTDCRTLIFSSSATVYGTQHTAPYAETVTPLSASNPYGETKIISEQLLQDLCQADSDWHITALRYFNPIGAHESGLLGEEPHGIPSNIAPYLALVASGQLPYFRVYGNDYDTPDGTGVRDYVHVMDLAEGHCNCTSNKPDRAVKKYPIPLCSAGRIRMRYQINCAKVYSIKRMPSASNSPNIGICRTLRSVTVNKTVRISREIALQSKVDS